MVTWGTTTEPEEAWGSGPVASTSGANDDVGWENKGDDASQAQQWDSGANDDTAKDTNGAQNGKCYGCGQEGHRAAECPNPREIVCRTCNAPGHIAKDCPDKPPMICGNCCEDGHMRKDCTNARKINRDHIADVDPEVAWAKLERAVAERDMDDVKEALGEYVKALNANITYRELQDAFLDNNMGLFLIGLERPLMKIFTNMDLQDRPREVESFPKSRQELLARLEDAGEVVNKGLPLCRNCDELGHTTKFCPQEKVVVERPKILCSNCDEEGHRLRDCPKPRKGNECRNCGKDGHKAADCEEPPNASNVQCRKCDEYGHFAKDCTDTSKVQCRKCDGYCTDTSKMQCRKCDEYGHFARDCTKAGGNVHRNNADAPADEGWPEANGNVRDKSDATTDEGWGGDWH